MSRAPGLLARLEVLNTTTWLGLMSGTSGDGIDAALVILEERAEATPRVVSVDGLTVPFPEPLSVQLIADLVTPPDIETAAIWDARLGERFADAARGAAERLGDADAIALSGHTFVHLPEHHPRTTLQLGSPALVAERTGLPVVSGFRAHDVARGGEGAPLVPAGDRILFGTADRGVAVVNLGGIGNITWLPRGSGEPRALDTGPANLILNRMVLEGTGGERPMDVDGALGARGTVRRELMEPWMDHPFLGDPEARSTGREQFGERWVEEHREQLRGFCLEDRLATAVAWIAATVALGLRRLAGEEPVGRILVGGGGAHNRALLRALQTTLPGPVECLSAERHGVDGDLREAAAFAVLGHEWLRGRPGSFPGTTGCLRAGPLGSVTLPAV